MSGRGTKTGVLLVTLLALASVVVPAAAHGALGGAITRAQATSDWTTASIAGVAVRPGDCIEPPKGPEPGPGEGEEPLEGPTIIDGPDSAPWTCGWIPYLTVGPGSVASDCSSWGRRWNSLGSEVQLLWLGPEDRGGGPLGFDLSGAPLEYGAAATLLCLAAVEAVPEGVGCPAVEGVKCPPYAIVHRTYQLDSAVLEATEPDLGLPSPPPLLGSPTPLPSPDSCKRPGKKAKGTNKKARIGIGPRIRASGKPQRVRRCKRG
jgi:hypothetical protein